MSCDRVTWAETETLRWVTFRWHDTDCASGIQTTYLDRPGIGRLGLRNDDVAEQGAHRHNPWMLFPIRVLHERVRVSGPGAWRVPEEAPQ